MAAMDQSNASAEAHSRNAFDSQLSWKAKNLIDL